MTETTDRELLTLAARAAGIEITADGSRLIAWRHMPGVECREWNPRDDDADAFRLAVTLNMGVKCNAPDHWQEPNCTIVIYEDDCARRIVVKHGKDKAAATRRAILRCAAALATKEDAHD